jgi:hypothetical protein
MKRQHLMTRNLMGEIPEGPSMTVSIAKIVDDGNNKE